MSRIALRIVAATLVAGCALSPAVASAQSPALRLHAIFTGGRATSYHVGEVLDVGVRDAGGRKLAQVCLSPAPISRPACSAARNAAPSQAGRTTVSATLSDGTKLSTSFTMRAPATKVGGPHAVPATIRCQDVTLYGNHDQRRHRSRDPRGTVKRGDRVALYNRIAPGKIFMWSYATNRGGFTTESCAQPATS
jgi:hypothetical protein